MAREIKSYTILDGIAILTATFTAATTDIITANSHGLKDGDRVVLTNTGGALPAGLAVSTVYMVRDALTNTFKLTLEANGVEGPPVDITGTGTGTHTWTMHDIGKSIYVGEWRHAIVSLSSASSANLTLKLQGSIGKSVATDDNWDNCPDFSAAQSVTNAWDYVGAIDMNTAIHYDGDTGLALAGTDDHKTWMVNIDALKWFNCRLTAWSAGTITCRIMLFND